jgi:hypothetical protein
LAKAWLPDVAMPRQKRFGSEKVQVRLVAKGQKFRIRRLPAFRIPKNLKPIANFHSKISRVKSLKVVGLRKFWHANLPLQ